MALTSISSSDSLAVKQWVDKAFQQYLSLLTVSRYMGTDEWSVIHVREDLLKSRGDKLEFSLISPPSGNGIEGDATLEGNEEEMKSFGFQVTLNQYRNAVRLAGRLTETRYPWDAWEEARPSLLNWKVQHDEKLVFRAMGSVDGIPYATATAAQRNTWNQNNQDRILYGATTANWNATHSTALGNVDSTNDILDTKHLSLLKRMAKMANPKIRPISVPQGPSMEMYVYFAHPYTTRDLKNDSAWINAQRDAAIRGMDNPLFTGAIGMWDGIVVVETDKIAILSGVGAGGIDVAQNFLCGAQAILWAQGGIDGMRFKFIDETFDYQNQRGVAVASIYGVEKARFQTGPSSVYKDHGVVTSFVAGVAD